MMLRQILAVKANFAGVRWNSASRSCKLYNRSDMLSLLPRSTFADRRASYGSAVCLFTPALLRPGRACPGQVVAASVQSGSVGGSHWTASLAAGSPDWRFSRPWRATGPAGVFLSSPFRRVNVYVPTNFFLNKLLAQTILHAQAGPYSGVLDGMFLGLGQIPTQTLSPSQGLTSITEANYTGYAGQPVV